MIFVLIFSEIQFYFYYFIFSFIEDVFCFFLSFQKRAHYEHIKLSMSLFL